MSENRRAVLNLSGEGLGIVRRIKDVGYTVNDHILTGKELSDLLTKLGVDA